MATTAVAGPVVALAAAVGLGALARWAFSPPRRARGSRHDFGLLVPATRALPRTDAERIQTLLAGHGIRATLAAAGEGYDASGRPWPPGSVHVLVFRQDAERAREIVPGSSG